MYLLQSHLVGCGNLSILRYPIKIKLKLRQPITIKLNKNKSKRERREQSLKSYDMIVTFIVDTNVENEFLKDLVRANCRDLPFSHCSK